MAVSATALFILFHTKYIRMWLTLPLSILPSTTSKLVPTLHLLPSKQLYEDLYTLLLWSDFGDTFTYYVHQNISTVSVTITAYMSAKLYLCNLIFTYHNRIYGYFLYGMCAGYTRGPSTLHDSENTFIYMTKLISKHTTRFFRRIHR